MRRRAKVDSNQDAIVKALRASGWLVLSLSELGGGVPDLIAWKPSQDLWRFIEVKTEKGKLTEAQWRFVNEGWPVYVVRTVDQALALR